MDRQQAIWLIKDHMEHHKIGEYPHILLGEALNMAIAALSPPNEPLTIEQLREMDGEPVWVETKAGLKFWGIVTKICVSSGDGRYLLITEDTEYGQTWVAYRRPPEGEA